MPPHGSPRDPAKKIVNGSIPDRLVPLDPIWNHIPTLNYCDTTSDLVPSLTSSTDNGTIIAETVTGDNSSTHLRTYKSACANKLPTAKCGSNTW